MYKYLFVPVLSRNSGGTDSIIENELQNIVDDWKWPNVEIVASVIKQTTIKSVF